MTKPLHKRLIEKWLADFVSVMCQLSAPCVRMAVMSGQSTVKVPPDIFDALRRRGVIQHATGGDFHFLTIPDDAGDVVVTVAPDSTLKNSLVLFTPDDVKR